MLLLVLLRCSCWCISCLLCIGDGGRRPLQRAAVAVNIMLAAMCSSGQAAHHTALQQPAVCQRTAPGGYVIGVVCCFECARVCLYMCMSVDRLVNLVTQRVTCGRHEMLLAQTHRPTELLQLQLLPSAQWSEQTQGNTHSPCMHAQSTHARTPQRASARATCGSAASTTAAS